MVYAADDHLLESMQLHEQIQEEIQAYYEKEGIEPPKKVEGKHLAYMMPFYFTDTHMMEMKLPEERTEKIIRPTKALLETHALDEVNGRPNQILITLAQYQREFDSDKVPTKELLGIHYVEKTNEPNKYFKAVAQPTRKYDSDYYPTKKLLETHQTVAKNEPNDIMKKAAQPMKRSPCEDVPTKKPFFDCISTKTLAYYARNARGETDQYMARNDQPRKTRYKKYRQIYNDRPQKQEVAQTRRRSFQEVALSTL
jgi:hypothetical protein